MLTHIDGEPAAGYTLAWECLLYERGGDLLSCGQARTCALAEVRFCSGEVGGVGASERGAVIALPACPTCGTRLFLKADYSVREVLLVTASVQNEAGETWAYAMRPDHARNLVAHGLLYQAGLAPRPPVLALPEPGDVAWAQLVGACLGLEEVAFCLWYGSSAVVARQHQLGAATDTGTWGGQRMIDAGNEG